MPGVPAEAAGSECEEQSEVSITNHQPFIVSSSRGRTVEKRRFCILIPAFTSLKNNLDSLSPWASTRGGKHEL
jgi:hypothetical protein